MPNLLTQLKKPKKEKLSFKEVQKREPKVFFIEDEANVVSTDDVDMGYPFPYLNPVQSAFYKIRNKDANFVVCAATSAGKTVIAELAKQEHGKFLYLSPLKAVTEEKKNDWSSLQHDWGIKEIAILTGDYSLSPEKVEVLRQAEIITLTSEMLDSRSRRINSEKNDWLLEVSTLVVDEAHLLAYESRGDKLESALMRFSKQNPEARIVALSATMENSNEIATWLSSLNYKDTYILISDYRPVELETKYITHSASGSYSENEESKIEKAEAIVRSYPEDKFIVFVHSKNTGRKLQSYFKSVGIPNEFHNADLSLADRQRIEKEFKSKAKNSLRVLISTSTLAWGINTPADSVILVGIHRGINLINSMDIKQMIGRAGRVGFTNNPIGKAFVLIPEKYPEKYIEYCEKPLKIQSKFQDINTLCFHVCSEVLLGEVRDTNSLISWYERSLAHAQGLIMEENEAVQILEILTNMKMLKKEDDKYSITNLGKVSAYMYYSPFDIYDLYKNFTYLTMNDIDIDDYTFSWAITQIDSIKQNYRMKAIEKLVFKFTENLRNNYKLNGSFEASQFGLALYSILTGTYSDLIVLNPLKRNIKFDMDRLMQALNMIDGLYARWNLTDKFKVYQMRIKYEVPEKLIELVQIPLIGGQRAKKLYSAGIKTKNDFYRKQRLAKAILGSNLYNKIMEKI